MVIKFRSALFLVNYLAYRVRGVFGFLAFVAFMCALGQIGNGDLGYAVNYAVLAAAIIAFGVCAWLGAREAPVIPKAVYRHWKNMPADTDGKTATRQRSATRCGRTNTNKGRAV